MKPNVRDPTADVVLKYISQILMEEESEDQTSTLHDSALQAAEKSFYHILAEKCSSSTNKAPPDQNLESQVSSSCCNLYGCSSRLTANNKVTSSLKCHLNEHQSSCIMPPRVNLAFQFSLQSNSSPSLPVGSIFGTADGQVDSSVNTARGWSQCYAQLNRGVNDSWQCPWHGNEMVLDFANNRVTAAVAAVAEKGKRRHSACKPRKRKNCHLAENELEMRGNKHFVVCAEEPQRSKTFENVLFSMGGDAEFAWFNHDVALQNEPGRMLCLKGQSRGSIGTRMNSINDQINIRESIDIRALLIHCAEAVACNDRRNATELLVQIRQHSTPSGGGSQRLAHCFSNALEARMAGTSSEVHSALAAKRVSATCLLKACSLFMSSSPFMNVTYFFATQTIMEVAKKAAKLHIIHFGILYGFPWLSLIQHLSTRPGGPPVLRITGIEFPHLGMFPASRLEDTGRHLTSYCKRYNVPFEYRAMSQGLECIQFEDLKVDRDEVIAVSSLYRFRHLLDESVGLNSQRDATLNLIKKINPHVFIHGIINGSYNSPFFISRFREALFYFSSVFDMLEVNAAQVDEDRTVHEQEIYGKEILNVIACEGLERLERPETYKQWQVRNLRAGLRQLPLNQEIMQKVRTQVKLCYHKDFLVDEDGRWMLQGWKGRTLFALSCWKSA